MAGKRGNRQHTRTRSAGQGKANWNHPDLPNEYSDIHMANNSCGSDPHSQGGPSYLPGYQDFLLRHGAGQGYRTPPAYGAPSPGSNALGPESENRHGYRTPPAYGAPSPGSNAFGPDSESRHWYRTPPAYGTPAPGSNAFSPLEIHNRPEFHRGFQSLDRGFSLDSCPPQAYASGGRLTTFDRLGFGQEPQRTEYVDHDDRLQATHPIVHRHAPLGMPRRLGSGPDKFERASWDYTRRSRSPQSCTRSQPNLSPRGGRSEDHCLRPKNSSRGWLPSRSGTHSPHSPCKSAQSNMWSDSHSDCHDGSPPLRTSNHYSHQNPSPPSRSDCYC